MPLRSTRTEEPRGDSLMEMSGERLIAASRAEVWRALNDPEVLKASIPGCQEIDKTSDTSFTAKVVQKVGPVKATFTGEVELTDIVEGEGYRISGKGKGGAAGGASGGAQVTLADADGGTLLTYEAEAKVTGKIAQLGSRLISGFAKKMADQFFTKFQETVEGPGEESDAAEAQDESASDKSGLEEKIDQIDEASKGVAANIGAAVDSAHERISQELGDLPEMPETLAEAEEKIDTASRDVASNLGEAIDSAHEKLADAAGDLQKTLSEAEPLKKSFWKKLFGG